MAPGCDARDLLTIESCHAALREKDAEHKRLKAETAKVINQNKQFLANMERKTAKDKPSETDAAEGMDKLGHVS